MIMLNFISPALAFLFQEGQPSSAELMKESATHPDLSKFLVIGALLFIIGVAGVLTRRNIIVIFMSIELILNAANLNFIAFSRYWSTTGGANAVAGQIFTVFVIVVAAAGCPVSPNTYAPRTVEVVAVPPFTRKALAALSENVLAPWS